MDPFECLNFDVLPHILQHLSVRNILQSSRVSSKWNSILSKSLVCMKKVWLRFYAPFDDVQSLMASKRKYRNVKIQRQLDGRVESAFYKYQWKEAMLRDMELRNHDDYNQLMQHLAPSVEKLEWWNLSILTNENSVSWDSPAFFGVQSVNFPLMKTLKCYFVCNSSELFSIFFGENNSLEDFIISLDESIQGWELVVVLSMVNQFLKQNQRIKHLTPDETSKIFLKDITKEMNLQLQSFSISLSIDENSRENLTKFIKSQKTLKKLSIYCREHEKSEEILSQIWDAMQCCENVELVDAPISLCLMNLRVQTTITTMKVTGKLRLINGLLNVTPKLETLRVGRLTDDILTFAAYSLKSLKVIEFMDQNGQIENYERMKQETVDINKKIILHQLTVNDFLHSENNS